MQNAETVLDVLRERGRRGLPLEELYRQLFNPQLYLLAYGRIVNGQVFVPAGGQVKVPAPRVDQVLFRVVPPLALASRMR